METHEHLVDKLVAAVAQGADPLPVLRAESVHLIHCPICQARLSRLADSLFGEETSVWLEILEDLGLIGEPPVYPQFDLSFLGLSSRLDARALPPQAQPAGQAPPAAALWKSLRTNVYRLLAEIPILIGNAPPSFGQLVPALQPQVVAVAPPRGRTTPAEATEDEAFRELLELPHPEANLVITLGVEPIARAKGALVIKVATMAPPAPLEQVKVSLRDEDDALLEIVPTDADGLAYFRDLGAGRYTVLVEKDGQIWSFTVPLQEQ